MKDRNLVLRVEDDMDPKDIYATTYQMRNFYAQFKDGFFSSLDVMNYIQHHKAVTMMKKGDRVLDVCCGRGLLLPLIRYYAKEIRQYVGVDISPANIGTQKRRSGVKPIEDMDNYYPFKIRHLICSCEDMDQKLRHDSFDFLVYTSSIEHMQRDVGARSLVNCFNLMKPGAQMFLSCPNTPDKKDPYEVQYKAHLYEWDDEELSTEVEKVGFDIIHKVGLVAKKRPLEVWAAKQSKEVREHYAQLKLYLPTTWLLAFFPILYPEVACEVLLICKKPREKIN